MRTLIAVLLGFALAGQVFAAQVIYDDATRRSESGPVFFMDRYGELYPPGSVSLDTRLMDVTGGSSPYVSAKDRDFARLKSFYRWKAGDGQGPEWQSLLSHLGIGGSGDFDRDWEAAQAALRSRVASGISQLGKNHDDVVLMVHGYNNGHQAALGWYAHTEDKLREAAASRGRRIAFVRMYWDGLDGKTPLFIWTRAQHNGYLVGVELRRILNLLDQATPLRIFTHSSGAFVVTNALGDGSASAQLGNLPGDYPNRAAGMTAGYRPPTQLTDLRVAMLIPAQPTTAFGNYFRQPGPGGGTVPAPGKTAALPARLILGVSRHDFATSKTFLAPCTFLGSTCMAVRVGETCHRVSSDLGISAPRLQVVEFPGWPVHRHGVKYYTDDDEWPLFTQALLAPDSEPAPGANGRCPVSTTTGG